MHNSIFSTLLTTLASSPTAVIDLRIPSSAYVPINISSSNPELSSFDISSSIEWELYIKRYLKTQNKLVAYGGYLEKREIYKRSAKFNQNNRKTERNIHIGLDLWVEEGTSVLAAFDASIHSFKNNAAYGDYGPTIILKHKIDNIVFYTLYGHLTSESLKNINVGRKILKGETIGIVGSAHENGDYAPHLHFQIIRDIQGNYGDYPGVVCKNDLFFYQNNCPNPLGILGL